MLSDLIKKIGIFEISREQSAFCKISLNNSKVNWERCDSQNCFPYAFILNEDHNLEKIDDLIKKFEIEKRGSEDFKNRLRDPVSENKTDDLNSYNAIESALSELLVADFLSTYENILDLAAWKNVGTDIKSDDIKSHITYYTEIKYLGQIPELYEHTINQIRNNISVSACWLPDILTLYTYLNMRMVDALIQLNSLSLHNNEKKRCFMLLKSSITSNNNIIQVVRDKKDWDEDKLTILCDRLNLPKDKYFKKSVSDWRKETDCLVIAYLNPSYIIDEKLNSQSI